MSLRFQKAYPKDVDKIINILSSDKSEGIDKIKVKEIKLLKSKLSPVIVLFINLCVENGVYPGQLKTALIRTIFKQGAHSDYSNYRPIAILSVKNKIEEKFIMNQVSAFLENNNILSNAQHGFRRGRSTATALAQFADDVNEGLGQRKQVVVVYIDFKKAFDTLEHHQLLQAMEECGVAGPLNRWFRDYLTDRALRTVIDGVVGEPRYVTCGVPTGSVFGPVGYIMHVNSMCNVVRNCHIYMYADNTCLVYADKELDVKRNIQEDFTNIIKWAHDNGIIININKTKCMRVRSPYLKNCERAPRVVGHSYDCLHDDATYCACADIEVVEEYKYLGLVIDNSFSWKTHIAHLCNKLRLVLVKFHHLSFVLDRATLYTVYFALVDSLLSYGLACYGNTFKTYLDKIKLLQIRFMKLLVDKNTKTRCKSSDYEELFLECKMLPVHQKVVLLLAIENYCKDEFKIETVRIRPQRNKCIRRFVVPTSTNYYGQRCRKCLVPTIFNDIPSDLENSCTTKKSFKNKMGKFLFITFCQNLITRDV